MNWKVNQEKCLTAFVAILYVGAAMGFDTAFTAGALTLALVIARS